MPDERRRPKDRKAQIARASAQAFSALGFHGVSMESIANRVGITATALYRHYPNKYHLFRGAVLTLGERLVEATRSADGVGAADDAAAELNRVVHALIGVTLAERESGALYRWEARYLRPEDQAMLMDQMRVVNHRIRTLLLAVRPDLDPSERRMLPPALLSVIGSVVDHRAKAPAGEICDVLSEVARGVLAADLPSARTPVPAPAVRRIYAASSAGPYESLLYGAMALFHTRGYHETSMEQIAATAGIPASGIYRYFEGKSDILATALRRSADLVSEELAAASGTATEPKRLLENLIASYVALSFANPELAVVYYAERHNLSVADQQLLRNVQSGTVGFWVRLVAECRPDLSCAGVRFRVHAAMALVVDMGRLVHYDGSAHHQACVRRLMGVTLFES